MTVPEKVPAEVETPDHVSAVVLQRLADKLVGKAPGAIVFGEPVMSQGVTVIPVARIGFGFGGTAGQAVGEDGLVSAGGEAKPLGFIEVKGGRTTYKPLRDPWASVLVPLVGGLLAGAAGAVILRHLARRGRR